MGSYGQWTSVRGNHFWWVWEWYCLSTGAKELKVLWCSRDCSLILIYHGSSAGRRGSSRTQPGSAGATRTCWPHTQWRSWEGGDRGDFFPFTCKSDSDRHKDVGTLGPLCSVQRLSRGTSGHVGIWTQDRRDTVLEESVLTGQFWTGHSSKSIKVPVPELL